MPTVSPQQVQTNSSITSASVNTPINQLASVINGGIDSSNIADGSITNAKLASATGDVGGAWQSWTPTVATGSLGIGATITGSYTRVGKTVIARFSATVNLSALNMVTTINPPITASTGAQGNVIGSAFYTDISASLDYQGIVVFDGSGKISPRITVSGTNGRADPTNNSNPFAWATGDTIKFQIVYETS